MMTDRAYSETKKKMPPTKEADKGSPESPSERAERAYNSIREMSRANEKLRDLGIIDSYPQVKKVASS